ncbi:hypothetical protein PAP_00280 [Palaeococcus pacificus DY20341]|uniref:HTH arsR-type domain-containing protein n=1 Tax=Palaeococcus pacificus DY20341 TaxID=1343739 RepID=A0A075LVK6_9EURY|nr:winged helix-turn-helix domain-containing protein [Palaeococcus pacificus]AIF68503.1 hypothetical protein PAP_00280 [Palaeococcus pacificus DY20341]
MRDVIVVTEPDMIKLLAEETRFKILSQLRDRPMTISELSERLKRDRSTIYRHVKALEDAGFLEKVAKERNEVLYARSARIFLVKPYGEDEEVVAFRIQYLQVEAERICSILKRAGFEIKNEEKTVNLIRDILREIEEKAREPIKKVENVEMSEIELFHFLNILVFLNSCEFCDKARQLKKMIGLDGY